MELLIKSSHSLVGCFCISYPIIGHSAGSWDMLLLMDKIHNLLVKYCYVQMFLLDTFKNYFEHWIVFTFPFKQYSKLMMPDNIFYWYSNKLMTFFFYLVVLGSNRPFQICQLVHMWMCILKVSLLSSIEQPADIFLGM